MSEDILEFNGDNRWLSNFYNCEFLYNNKKWRSSEHAYQAMKTLDEEEHESIRVSVTAARAKKLGSSVNLRDDWELVKVQVMREIVKAKFLQNEELYNKLLATGDCQIIEGNNWSDKFWGICDGEGKNLLGIILMDLRHVLRESS